MKDERGQCSLILRQILIHESLVTSEDEATAIIESIVHEKSQEFVDRHKTETIIHDVISYALKEYFSLPEQDVIRILQKYCKPSEDDVDIYNDDVGIDNEYDISHNDEMVEDDIDQEETIGPGECVLCERDCSKLTRHHLIPRSTWKRIEPMILLCWNKSIEQPSTNNHANSTDEFEHLIPTIKQLASTIPNCQTHHGRQAAPGKRIIRQVLTHETVDICRPCHDHIHRSYDNRTLALQYNTINKLINDPTIAKYAKWANRQYRFKQR